MLIKNVRIITWNENNEIIENGAIEIQNGIITKVFRNMTGLADYQEEVIDGAGQLAMPGNICAHTHFYGAFSRGMVLKGDPAQTFPEILKKLWWPLDKVLDQEAVKLSALVCIMDAIKHGTTMLFDHHASQREILGSLGCIAEVVRRTGIRADLCYEVSDRAGVTGVDQGIEENLNFLKFVESEKPDLLRAHFGLHASLSLSESTLKKIRERTPVGTGFHLHAAEHSCDEYDSLDKYGLRVIDRLNTHGLLRKNTIIAHGVYLDQHELELLQVNESWLAHQPRSNMNNGVGLADIESVLRAGMKVVMGNDGFSNSMWEEWRACYLAHKLWNKDPRRMPADKVIQISVKNNRELANQSFSGLKFGVIEEKAAADLILVDYSPFTEINPGNLPWHILFGFRDSMITTTIVAGKVLMAARKLITIDEKDITRQALEVSRYIWEKYHAESINYQ